MSVVIDDEEAISVLKMEQNINENMSDTAIRLIVERDDFLSLEELKEINEGIEDIKAGRYYSTEQLKKELGL